MLPLQKILKDTEDKMKKALEATDREFSEVRTGRASPHLVEGLMIEYYGTHTSLKQIASISIPDARLIVIQPWDKNALPEIEKAILKSNIGIMPTNDGKVIRLAIPQLSKERREELSKVVKDMTEAGRISLRTIRHEAKSAIEAAEKNKQIAEDEKFNGLDQLQKLTENYTKKIEDHLAAKQKELMEF
jgi:ribosome recycling factor